MDSKGHDSQQDETGFEQLLAKSKEGDAEAQNNLGMSYITGEGVRKNAKEAVKWVCKAADQGDAEAQKNLGVMYATGVGVLRDDKEAVKWFRKAADQGDAEAQSSLGLIYANREFETSVPLSDFPPEWRYRISKYGSWLDALTSGELVPFTLKQKLFVLAVECRTRCSFDPVSQGWIALSNLNSLINACCAEEYCERDDLFWRYEYRSDEIYEGLIVTFSCTGVWNGPAEVLANAQLQPGDPMDALNAVSSIPQLDGYTLQEAPKLLDAVERIVALMEIHQQPVNEINISGLPFIRNIAPDIIEWVDMWSEFLTLRNNRRYVHEYVIERDDGTEVEMVSVWESKEAYDEHERAVSEIAGWESRLISDMIGGGGDRYAEPDSEREYGSGEDQASEGWNDGDLDNY